MFSVPGKHRRAGLPRTGPPQHLLHDCALSDAALLVRRGVETGEWFLHQLLTIRGRGTCSRGERDKRREKPNRQPRLESAVQWLAGGDNLSSSDGHAPRKGTAGIAAPQGPADCAGRCDLSTQRYDANLLRCFGPTRATSAAEGSCPAEVRLDCWLRLPPRTSLRVAVQLRRRTGPRRHPLKRHTRTGKARGVVGTGAARRMTRPGGRAASTSESGVPGSADLPPVSPTHRSRPRRFGLRGAGGCQP
jgi:hypothetical protein